MDSPEPFGARRYGIMDPAYHLAVGSSEILYPTRCETLGSDGITDLPLGSMRMSVSKVFFMYELEV